MPRFVILIIIVCLFAGCTNETREPDERDDALPPESSLWPPILGTTGGHGELHWANCRSYAITIPADREAVADELPDGFTLASAPGTHVLVTWAIWNCPGIAPDNSTVWEGVEMGYLAVAVEPPRDHVRADAAAAYLLTVFTNHHEVHDTFASWGWNPHMAEIEISVDPLTMNISLTIGDGYGAAEGIRIQTLNNATLSGDIRLFSSSPNGTTFADRIYTTANAGSNLSQPGRFEWSGQPFERYASEASALAVIDDDIDSSRWTFGGVVLETT